MACLTDKFVINQGMSNEFIITIKQNDSTLPMVITPTDTFEMKLFKLEDNTVVSTVTMTAGTDGEVAVHDDANGQILITLTDTLVDSLETARGDRADYYYDKPLYRIAIDCNTENNGNFVAKIAKVYVS